MGVSLSVFKIKDYKKEKLVGDKEVTTLNGQLTLKDLEIMDELGSAKSTLKLKGYDKEKDIANYEAVHFSETIKNPVRVFLIDDYSDIQEEGLNINPLEVIKKGSQVLENGYQEVFKFEVLIDFKTEEIFVFTKKYVALSFMKRLRNSKNLDFELMEFDLAKIDEITELDNVWGLWEDSTGRCKKKAYFGTEVHKEEGVEVKNITSYNVIYSYGNNSIGLIICRECRISSNYSILTNTDLFKIYQSLKKELKKNGIIK
jgi:hypothetical protein